MRKYSGFLVAAVFVGSFFAAGISSADEWAKPVRGLTGRLVVEAVDEHVRLAVELKNEGVLSYWVTMHSPFTFDLAVKSPDGSEIKPDAERGDITSSPQAAIVPRECRLAMPVTITQAGWNLDIVTKLWKLKPGKYRLSGKYEIPGKDKEPRQKGEAYTWQGVLELPEVEIEVR